MVQFGGPDFTLIARAPLFVATPRATDLPRRVDDILTIYPGVVSRAGSSPEIRYYLTCFKRGIEIQVYSERKSCPEEIVRQLWPYKLQQTYGYHLSQIDVEFSVAFGTVTASKAADIIVFQNDGRTAKVILHVHPSDVRECTNPVRFERLVDRVAKTP